MLLIEFDWFKLDEKWITFSLFIIIFMHIYVFFLYKNMNTAPHIHYIIIIIYYL